MPIDPNKSATTGVDPRVFVKFGVFGKHPGWADHIRDESKQTFGLSLDSPAMLQLFDFLYNAGIHRNMDVWKNRLQDAQRLPGFDHVILWRSGPADWLLVRLWPSRDTSGRADFPMAAVVHVHGLPATTALVALCEKLESARQTLTDCATAADVIATVARINAELSSDLARWTDDVTLPVGTAAVALSKDPAFAADEASLVSVVVRIDSAVGRRKSAGKQAAAAPEHLRLPVHGLTPAAALQGWTELLVARTGGQEELFTAVALSQRWADVIVGRPSVESLVCLRASDQYLPVATDVRHTGEPEQQASAQAFVTQLASGQVVMPRGSSSGPIGVARPMGASGPGGLDRKTLILIIAVAFGVVVTILVIALMLLTGGGKQDKSSSSSNSSPASSSSSAAASGASTPVPAVRSDGGGATATNQLKNPSWEELCTAYTGWVSTLVADVADLSEETRSTLNQDAQIRRWLESVTTTAAQADPRLVAGQRGASISGLMKNPPASVRTPAGITKTNEAMQSLRTLLSELTEDKWPAMKRTIVTAKAMDERGFKTVASTLTAATNLRDETGAIQLDHVAKIVALQPQIDAAEQAWSALAARAKVLLQTGDKTLSQYQLIAQTSAAGAADLPQLARSINDAVKAGEPIDAFVKQTFSRDDLFDKAAFAQAQAARSPGAATATMQDVQAWLTRAADYRKLTSDPRGKPDRWDGELGSVASHLKLIVDIPAAADASQGIQRRLEQVKAQLSELQKIAPLAMNQSRITKQTAAVEDEVAKLALDVRTQVARHTIDPAQWLKTQRETESISIVNKSAAIDGAWRRGRDALLKDVNEAALKADPTKLPALQDQVRRLRESLEQLDGDQRLAQLSDSVGAPAWQDRARKEVWNQRESAMATCVSALAGVAEGKPVVDDAAFVGKRDQTAKSYHAWVESFVQKLRLAERLETAMDQARLLSEPMDDSDATTVDATAASLLSDKQMAWLTTDEQALVRVKALRAMGKAAIIERAALATKASGGAGEPLVIRRAAWRALGETSSQQWPANLQELEAERDMAAALERDMTADATLANDKARLGVLTAEIAAQSRVRWERAFVAISGRSDLDKARAMMAAIGVDEAKLAPAARYRLSLLSLAEKIAAARVEKADDEKLRSILDTFTRGMTAELRGTEPAKKLLTKLGELTDSQKSSGKAASLGSVGPGKSGWTAQPSPDGDSVVYTHPSAPMRVEFIRVASGGRDAKACYLAATELSVSQFLQACADAGDASHSWVKRWDVVNSADPRRGPRVWDLDNSGVRIASTWLDEKTSASAGDGSRPGPDHPMQWLPVTGAMELAASLGCRLPTVAEWSAAAKSAQNTQTQTNLRDKRYQAQMARAAGVQGLKQPWPADGIFRLASERGSPSTDDKLVTDTDDGTLWFAPVGATNDEASSSTSTGKETARFWHLRGNVAEYVTLASQGDKTAPQDVMVIGESALSPPRQERDQPLPIGASQASTGCSDVGLRLAFDAPFESLAASVSKLLASDDVWGFAGKAK